MPYSRPAAVKLYNSSITFLTARVELHVGVQYHRTDTKINWMTYKTDCRMPTKRVIVLSTCINVNPSNLTDRQDGVSSDTSPTPALTPPTETLSTAAPNRNLQAVVRPRMSEVSPDRLGQPDQ